MPLYIETFNSSSVWFCPTGVTKIDVEGWGGGATQGAVIVGKGGMPGGGGGAYSYKSGYAVTVGSGYLISVGTGGVNGTWFGGPSYFASTSTLYAAGGSTTAVQSDRSVGGLASNCIGDIKYNGGSGGSSLSTKEAYGGGGGASAGAYSHGDFGDDDAGLSLPNLGGEAYIGNPPRMNGAGGTGGSGVQVTNGTAPGGGAGGGIEGTSIASGAAGRINIFYWSGMPVNQYYDYRSYIGRRLSANGC
jgi:hypothetical protein